MVKEPCGCGCSDNKQTCDCEIIHSDVVKKVKSQMLEDLCISKMADFYKAFSDNTRLKIIDILYRHEMCVCDISALLNMTKSAVSHQLGYLRELNIVKTRRDGKIVFYSLADEHVNEIFDVCHEHIVESMENN